MLITPQDIQKLPSNYQEELFDFLQYLLGKAEREKRHLQEDHDWLGLSLSSAMQGMEWEEESTYSQNDIKVSFT